jgi:large subunit ribosomal protein L35
VPKMKSHRGAAKRFQISRTGKIRRRRAYGAHLFEKKPSTRKRRLRSPDVVAKADEKRIRKLLGG